MLLIEDAASGQQLIQMLRADEPAGVPSPISRSPKGDKTSRVMGASGMIQAGRLFIPERGHWVGEYTGELLGFPGAAFDNQVDATTQLLLWVQEKDLYRVPVNAGPELIEEGNWYRSRPCDPGPDDDPWGA